MKARALKGESDEAEINISPLIDMVFILLIFFIVTTVFVEEEGLGIETPTPVPPTDLVNIEPFILTIEKGGAVYYEGKEIGYDGVDYAIINARNAGTLESVTIEAHPHAKVGAIAKVLDTCARLKVEKVVTKSTDE